MAESSTLTCSRSSHKLSRSCCAFSHDQLSGVASENYSQAKSPNRDPFTPEYFVTHQMRNYDCR